MALHAEAYWRSRFAEDRRTLEERRQQGLAQARSTAQRFRERWPQLKGLWLFGSLLGPGFREHSDLDLLAEGLPTEALIEAINMA
jgi:predicted nucleotidyltransferase